MDPSPTPPRWYRRPVWLATIVATILVPILGAYFVFRQTRLAARAALPQVKLLSRNDMPFRGPVVDGMGLWVCRAELRLANTGGAGTAIVQITPTGPLDEDGFLPDLDVLIREVGVDFPRFIPLFGRWIPLVTPYLDTTRLRGPFPYRLGIADAGSPGLIPSSLVDEASPVDEADGGIGTTNELRWGIKDALDRSAFPFDIGSRISRALSLEPLGLPYELPPHSVRDAAIDFAVQIPDGFRLDDPRLRRQLQDVGAGLGVGFLLRFSDGPLLRIPPSDCGGLLTVSSAR